MSTMRIIVLLIVVGLAAAWSTACTATSCTRSPDSLNVGLDAGGADGGAEAGADGGAEAGADGGTEFRADISTGIKDKTGDIYYSAPYGVGPYAYFPPFRTITFEHDLGVIPVVEFWLAFSARGTLAPSAGNITELRVGDDGGANALTPDTISVYNNTCSDFYLWVEAKR
jgi:hypothetical protein